LFCGQDQQGGETMERLLAAWSVGALLTLVGFHVKVRVATDTFPWVRFEFRKPSAKECLCIVVLWGVTVTLFWVVLYKLPKVLD